uniref:Gustatory receptor n=1 Tax=Strigamia maritima TaxID=126957 RepID=T1JHC0_STRMM
MAENAETIYYSVEDLGLKFINRVWRVLFGVFGLQLDLLRPCDSKCWRKNICAAFTQFLYVVTSLHIDFIIIYHHIEYDTHNVLFTFAVATLLISQLIVFSTAIICRKRQKKISAIYGKIVFGLSTAGRLLNKLDKSTKLYFFIVLVTSVMTSIIDILMETSIGSFLQRCILIHAKMGIQNDYFNTATATLDLSVYLVFVLFMDIMFVYFAHLCAGLALNFVLFNRCLEAKVYSMSLTPSKLNVLRHRFEYISGLVDEVGYLFSPLILFWILSLVSNICLNIQTLKKLKSTSDIFYIISRVLQFVRGFRGITYLVLILKDSAQINTQAHLMKRRLYTKVMDESRDRDASKLIFCTNYLVFSETVSNSNVGISVSGLFTLNATSILSIAGTVLTYSIVLYQTS